MPYADFAYYTSIFGGQEIATAEEFKPLSRKASFIINKRVGGQVIDVNEAIKDACCALAEILRRQNLDGQGGAVTHESVGGHSVSYKASSVKSFDDLINEEIWLYLSGTGLLSLACEYKRGFWNED